MTHAKHDDRRAPPRGMPIHLRKRGRKCAGPHQINEVHIGAELTSEEVAYARFIDAKKHRLHVMFPAWSEVLAWTKEFLVLQSLAS